MHTTYTRYLLLLPRRLDNGYMHEHGSSSIIHVLFVNIHGMLFLHFVVWTGTTFISSWRNIMVKNKQQKYAFCNGRHQPTHLSVDWRIYCLPYPCLRCLSGEFWWAVCACNNARRCVCVRHAWRLTVSLVSVVAGCLVFPKHAA